MPTAPTFLMSATEAMPLMMVRKTMGPISIFIALTNVVPSGSIATAKAGASQPTRMPATMATRTQKYRWR